MEDLRHTDVRSRMLVIGLASYALTGGGVTLVGWLGHLPRLTDWMNSGIAMFPNTAIAAICSGAALILSVLTPRWCRRCSTILGLVVAALGGMTLVQHLANINLGIDTLFINPTWGSRAAVAPGRMGPPASTAFALLGLALIFATSRQARTRRHVPSFGIVVCLLSTLSLMGYLLGADPLFAVAKYTGIAMQTASMLLALGLGVVASVPEFEPVRTLQESTAAGALARRSLPFIVLLPLLLGWLRLRAEKVGWFDPAMGTSLFTLALVAILLVLLCWWVSAVAKYEAALHKSDRALREHSERIAADLKAMNRLRETASLCSRAEHDFPKCLREILTTAIELTVADKGEIQLLLEHSGALKTAVQIGLAEPFLRFFESAHDKAASAGGLAVESKQCVIVEDVTRSEIFSGEPSLQVLLEAEVRSVYSVPLINGAGQMLGVISVYFREPKQPSQSEFNFMELLARQAGNYIERKQAEGKLREAHEQLSSRAVQLEALVQERTAKLENMVGDLQHISYAMVHDMRAPLRAMDAFVELMCEAQTTREQQQDYSRRIRKAAVRLDHLIQHALLYTKFAHQEIALEPVDLSLLIRGIIQTYPNLHADNVEIVIEGVLPTVIGNEVLLTQCFSNLLGNAVKFVAPGVAPKVRVETEIKHGTVRIWVRDNGVGIPQYSQRRLFQMFQRLHEDYEGTGIGLAIVRKVVDRMNGQVGVESDEGRGSSFWVELPLSAAQRS